MSFVTDYVGVFRFTCSRWATSVQKVALAVVSITVVLAGHALAPSAGAASHTAKVDELIVRYELGAPPVRWNGRPWGSQCVQGALAQQLRTGRWIGAGMRIIRFDRFVTPKTAQRVATQFQRCPYVAWAEPEGYLLFVE
jgi:hypothetical protein